jgi:hypothetical protein
MGQGRFARATQNDCAAQPWQSIEAGMGRRERPNSAKSGIPGRGLGIRICYTITEQSLPLSIGPMATHHHHHAPGHAHPPAALAPSILRLSAVQRLGIAGLLAVLIWAAVYWAMA